MFDSSAVIGPDVHPDIDESASGVPTDWREGFREATADEPRYTPALARPSEWLALELDADTVDATRLGDGELVDAVIAFEHLAGWVGARQARLLAEFARRRPGDDPVLVGGDKASVMSRFAPDEVALALSQSRYTAKARLGQAAQLTTMLVDTLTAWEAGRIDGSKVRAICDTTHLLPADTATRVQTRVLPRAGSQSLAQLKASLKRAVLVADPDGAATRHKAARTERRVCVGAEHDGMASLWALLPAHAATASHQWLTRLARGLGTHDPRGMDARRADLLTDLLTGNLTVLADTPNPTATGTGATGACCGRADGGGAAGAGDGVPADPGSTDGPGSDRPAGDRPGAEGPAGDGAGSDDGGAAPATGVPRQLRPVTPGKPLVQIVMAHTTLLGVDDQPGELVGYGPIPADLAREIAADGIWTRLITDPLSGALLDHGRNTYRPPAALADFARARDVHCRYPTCRRRAADAELDHTIPSPEGPTADWNLNSGCTHHHHHLKHQAGWTVTQHRDGRITWTTPTGHTYTSDPYDYRPEPADRPTPAPATAIPHDPPPPLTRPQRPVDPWASVRGTTDDDPPPF